MMIRDLKEIIKDLPDNAIIVKSGHDHDYRECYLSSYKVVKYDDGYMTEYYDGCEETYKELGKFKIISALIVD